MKRRTFLKTSSLVTASALVPRFLQGTAALLGGGVGGHRNLVVVQLSGGNDGLNTVVPIGNDIYHNLRPQLGLQGKEVLGLTDEWGFNANLTGLRALYDRGLVTVVHGVGYPEPNRSHFRSMDVWHTASTGNEYISSGWLGRYLDDLQHAQPYHALESSETLSRVLKGAQQSGLAMDDLERFLKGVQDPAVQAVCQSTHHHHAEEHHHAQVAYLHQTLTRTVDSAAYLKAHRPVKNPNVEYPQSKLSAQLRDVAGFIGAGSETKVYYTGMGGFDTHANQQGSQGRLLKQLGDSLEAFVRDLESRNRLNDTLVLVFSEFGRRVKQNAGRGTDHGTANCVFVIGNQLKVPGMLGTPPNLADLDNGDLKFTTDYRSIYAGILRDWLGANHARIIDPAVQVLPIIK